ncbi:MAG: MBOAT family O-acyltransferase [Crocinitomicaceae bacterium]|nr:MBOAT family O-acyltransferase [Crocinitomicaceae bacterium]
MESWSRFMDVFSLSFDDASPLNFVQLNFWIFFLVAISVYTILDLSKKTKTNAFYITIGLAIVGVLGITISAIQSGFGNFEFKLTVLDCWLMFIAGVFFLSRFKEKFWVRSFFLTVISFFFYFKSSGLFVVLLGLSLVVNYFIGKKVFASEKEGTRKWILALGIVFNVGILLYFKYAYFFTEAFNTTFATNFEPINHFAHWANGFFGEGTFIERILLPVGVSFFTFQSISYSVDIYRIEIEPVKSFFDYSFFVTFFPQLVAGPIVRAKDFIPQIRKPYELDNTDFSWAIVQIVKGLIKKIVLADYIAIHFIDHIAEAPEMFPGFVSILAMWGYSLQIYGDFSGYTDIAIGLSRLMGFNIKENFNSPYKALSVADFWRRWHISLGSWLRDYLYIPLGGNRRGGLGTYVVSTIIFIFLIFITKWYALIFVYIGMLIIYTYGWLFIKDFNRLVHRDLNLLITMVIGGLWHGASKNFVIWGALNGIALVIYKYWKKISPYKENTSGLSRFWKIFITFNFITFTRIWFRLEDDDLPLQMLNQIVHHFDFSWTVFLEVISTYWSAFALIVIGFVLHWLPGAIKKGWELRFEKMTLPLKALSVALIIFLVYQTAVDGGKPFVYFQF